MAIIQDWKIRSTQARCEITGEPFADGEAFYTCIFEDPETESFLRRDYSVDAWKDVRKSLDPAPFSFWKSTFKAPVREVVDKRGEDASIEGMLRRFVEDDDRQTENARYILAIMLERKKILVQTDSREAGERTLLFYEHTDSGDVFVVADPGLRLDEVESVQREVSELLAAEERRLDELDAASETLGNAGEEHGDQHDDQTGDDRERSAKAEEEAVAVAGEESAEGFRTDPGVGAGEELAQKVESHLDGAEGREEPAAPDHDR